MSDMRPIQPYFALSSDKYYKRNLQQNGIAHFYSYTVDYADENKTIEIPDGCIDLMFDYGDGTLGPDEYGKLPGLCPHLCQHGL